MAGQQKALPDQAVRRSLEFVRKNMIQAAYLSRFMMLALYVLAFFGRRSREFLVMSAWTVGAAIWCVVHLTRGWAPWNVYLFRVLVQKPEPGPETALQQAVRQYLRRPNYLRREALASLIAALAPWTIFGLSSALGFGSIGFHPIKPASLAIFFGLVIGAADAKFWALFPMSWSLAGARRSWKQLLAEAGEQTKALA